MMKKSSLFQRINILLYSFLMFSSIGFALDKTVYVVSTAHLDSQWDWTVQSTIRDAIKKTLEQNFALMDKYPNYKFNFEGAIHYMWAKEYYPDLYAKLKTYVAQGRWNVAGSSLNANDVLIPSTESFFRNVLIGQTFFKNEFGKKSNDIFLPDCFGFGYTLPTIAAHCGLKGFSSQKLSWGSAYGTPFPFGVWQGVDGSQILAALDPGGYGTTYNSDVSQKTDYLSAVNKTGIASGHYVGYQYYGTGDFGGSPTDESVSWVEKSIPGKGAGPLKVVVATSGEIFNQFTTAQYKDFPLYNGELPMKWHGTGCYTSHCAMKLWNRKNELLGKAAEQSAVMASWLGGLPYPKKELDEAWIKLIWHQFHDDLTGTSIPEAYTFSLNDEVICQNKFSTVLQNAAGATVRSLDTRTEGSSIVVYNPLSINREDLVEASIAAPSKPAAVRIFDKDGVETPAQITSYKDGKVSFLFTPNVKSIGYAVYAARVSASIPEFTSNLKITENTLENSVYKVTINPKGDVSSIIDKRYNNKELVRLPLRLAFMSDKSSFWPSWEIVTESVTEAPRSYVDGTPTITIEENGPVRVTLKIVREKNGSVFVQRIRLTENGPKERVDFVTGIEWGTKKALLKANFPLIMYNSKATYDLGLGTIERPNNTANLFEVFAQQWADLTNDDDSYGVSILNDSKYGWDKPNNYTLRLTLIHSPEVTDRYLHQGNQDLGSHQFTYSIYGHAGKVSDSNTQWEAAKLNEPMLTFEAPKHDGALGKSVSFVDISTDQVAIKTLKKAENSDDIVFRVYELKGKSAGNVTVNFSADIASAAELNGIEEKIGEVGFSGKSLTFNLTPFQPKTFSVKLTAPATATSAPDCKPVTLIYNKDAFTFDTDRSNGYFDEREHSYSANLVPDSILSDGIVFKMGPKTAGANNIVNCRGNSINIPTGYKKLYILAATSLYQTDIESIFKVNNTPFNLNIQYFSDQVGAWNTIETKDGDKVTIKPGFFKKENIAWVGTHRHKKDGDEPYVFTYMFKYCIELPENATKLILPTNQNISIFAITAANNENDDTKPAMELRTIIQPVSVADIDETDHCTVIFSQAKIVKVSGQTGAAEAGKYAIDGNINKKWCAGEQGDKWLEVDLGEEQEICQWYVLHAGCENKNAITADFKLQKKVGEIWQDVDVVVGNLSNETKRSVSFTARYVRLYITKPEFDNVNGAARIYEFAVYGAESQTSLERLEKDLNIRLLPNPAKTTVQLETGSTDLTLSKVDLMDLNGFILKTYSVNSNKQILDVSSLNAGIYLLKIYTSGSSFIVKKLIKE